VGDGSRWGVKASFSEEPVILDTGGGVKNIEGWLESAELLILNSDSAFDHSLDLPALLAKHRKSGSLMTLLTGPGSEDFTKLWTGPGGRLCGFGGKKGPEGSTAVSYLGGMVISRALFSEFPERGTPFSLTSAVIPGLLLETP